MHNTLASLYHMAMYIFTITCRAWQKNLHSLVQNDTHKAEMYKYLWLLMTSQDPEDFQHDIKAFILLWKNAEPRFITYFEDNYANRVGKNLYA